MSDTSSKLVDRHILRQRARALRRPSPLCSEKENNERAARAELLELNAADDDTPTAA